MEYWKYRLNSLRFINIIFIIVFSSITVIHKIVYNESFFYNAIVSSVMGMLLLVVLALSYVETLEKYYQKILYTLMWVITIGATNFVYLVNYNHFFLIHILLLITSVFAIFNKKIVGKFSVLYLISVIPFIIISEVELGKQLVSGVAIIVILSLSYMKSVYDFNIFKSYKDANHAQMMLLENALEAFALQEIIVDDQNIPIDYRFISINSAFEKMTGLSRDAIIGKRVLEVFPKTEQSWIDIYGEVALKKVTKKFTKYSKGLEKYYQVSAYPIEERKFATLFSDVSTRIQAEIKTKYAVQKSEKANQLKVQFLRDVNHRLRTPLNGMMGMLQLIDVEQIGEENKELFEAMLMEMRHSRNIIDQISKFVDIQGMDFEYTENDIVELLLEEIENVTADEIDIRFTNAGCCKQVIYFEKEVVKSVFKELLDNGIKHTKNNRVDVNLDCQWDEEKKVNNYSIEIIDYGQGMREDQKELIFNEFYHHDFINIYKPQNKLSIPMCKQILLNSGGDLLVESEIGIGTKFIIKFPCYVE